jgi:hypothetical protein
LESGDLLIVDAKFAPAAEDGLLVELEPGAYVVERKLVDYGGDVRNAVLRVLQPGQDGERGVQLGTMWTDTGDAGVCDYQAACEAADADFEGFHERIENAIWHSREPSGGEVALAEGQQPRMVFISSGFGDGTFPVWELVAGGERIGAEVEFIKPGTAYPFGTPPGGQ